MNSSQKAGLGMIIAIVLSLAAPVCQLMGVQVPQWIAQAVPIVTGILGIFGISVNMPADTNKKASLFRSYKG